MRSSATQTAPGLEALLALPVVRGTESGEIRKDTADAPGGSGLPRARLDSERAYRFCKAVTEQPLLPSSQYPSLAGVSSQTAKRIREQLLDAHLIREHRFDSGRRGRTAVLLEALPDAAAALAEFEAQNERGR